MESSLACSSVGSVLFYTAFPYFRSLFNLETFSTIVLDLVVVFAFLSTFLFFRRCLIGFPHYPLAGFVIVFRHSFISSPIRRRPAGLPTMPIDKGLLLWETRSRVRHQQG